MVRRELGIDVRGSGRGRGGADGEDVTSDEDALGPDGTGNALAGEALGGSGAGEAAWTGEALAGHGAGLAAGTGDAGDCFPGDMALGGATWNGLLGAGAVSFMGEKGLGERLLGDARVGDDDAGTRPSAGDMGVRGLGGAVVWPRINARRVSVKGSVILSKSIVS